MRLPLALLLALAAPLAVAEPRGCDTSNVTIMNGEPEVQARVCRAADHAAALFSECDMALPIPIEITLRPELPDACLGLFHCGTNTIEILLPEAMEAHRSSDSYLAEVPADRYFSSVVVHELAHALGDGMPCPFPSCVATAEYFAYAWQIRSLPPEDRATVAAQLPEGRRVAWDEINAMMLMLAPDRFAAKAWSHAHQREDSCQWLRSVLAGDLVFDFELP